MSQKYVQCVLQCFEMTLEMELCVCVCAGVDCGLLEPPQNGQVMVMGTTLGSRAMYTCNSGYVLLGSVTRRCEADGTWSGSEPTCSGTE